MNTTSKKIAFVDTQVNGYQTLLQDFDASTEIVLISGGDGLHQIAQTLSIQHDLDAVYVVSHGSAGSVQLGNLTLNDSNLAQHSADLATLGAALKPQGDLLFYGCDIAQGMAGQTWVNHLAQATGADMAASNNLTGAASKGGDWNLEVKSGNIEANLPFSAAALHDFSGLLAGGSTTYQFSTASDNTGYISETIGGHTLNMHGVAMSAALDSGHWINNVDNSNLYFEFSDSEQFTPVSFSFKVPEGHSSPFQIALKYYLPNASTFNTTTQAVNSGDGWVSFGFISPPDSVKLKASLQIYNDGAGRFIDFSAGSFSIDNFAVNFPVVNHAPTISDLPELAQTVTTGTAAALADFTVADSDSSDELTVTLTATNGTINDLTDADEGAEGIQLTGTASSINTAIAG
ncbi:MAG: DUF4347 domain-containing protein, partial [Burkholderiaceae bacterium]|nr:DUF4347 domain-containing protein [Burkholderiaceae bacterium]